MVVYKYLTDPKDLHLIDAFAHQTIGTTNNREEMKAILWALYNYGVSADSFTYPIVYTDSMYCVNTFNDWMYRWKNNNWRKADKSTPENLDLIKFYDIIYNKWNKKIDLRKIKGHAGIEGNELADDLATGRVTAKEVLNE